MYFEIAKGETLTETIKQCGYNITTGRNKGKLCTSKGVKHWNGLCFFHWCEINGIEKRTDKTKRENRKKIQW
jgi:hypothetical protein